MFVKEIDVFDALNMQYGYKSEIVCGNKYIFKNIMGGALSGLLFYENSK